MAGRVDPVLVTEYGDLALWSTTVRVAGAAGAATRALLAHLSNSYRGADVVRMRGRTAAHESFRSFARQVGLDPDRSPSRVDAAAREAVVDGRLRSTGPVPDALLAVAVQSGVPVWALDARRVAGELSLRLARGGERRARRDPVPTHGTILVADDDGPLAPLLGDPLPSVDGTRARTVVLYAVGVPGLPVWDASEAVWSAARALT